MKPKKNQTGIPAMDCCQTPSYAVGPLLEYLPLSGDIWESAAGDGWLAAALVAGGNKVVTSDILTQQNFFDYEPENWQVQVTNPPYSIKYPWLQRSYELGKPFALLVPVETLGAKTAQRLFEKYGVEIMLLDARVDFAMPRRGLSSEGWKSSAQFPVLWLTWQLLPAPIVYGHLDKKMRAASGLKQMDFFA